MGIQKKETIMKVAVIGIGNMGMHHVRKYLEIENAELVAVCEPNQQILNNFRENYPNIPAYTDVNELIAKEDFSAVSIVVPTVFHYQIAKELIKAKKHVLIEKPFAASLEQADELIALAKVENITLMVGHVERFNPVIKKIKELIISGKLGEVFSIIGTRISPFPTQIRDTNVLMDLAIHDLDLLNYLLDEEPLKVQVNKGKTLVNDKEDHAEIFLQYKKASGFIKVNWLTPIRIRGINITGTKGYLEANYMTQELIFYPSEYETVRNNFGIPSIQFNVAEKELIEIPKEEPLKNELIHFLDCVENKLLPISNGNTAKIALKLALS